MKRFSILLTLLVLAVIVAACAPAPTPIPTAAPPTAAPKPVPTAAPPTAAPQPTSAPPTAASPAPVAPTAVASPTITTGGILRLARSGDTQGWDPIQVSSNPSSWALDLVYGRLARVNDDATGMSPDLASSWDVATDGKSITYRLRSGLKNSDGTPFTASDVLFSLQRYQTDSPQKSLLAGRTFTSPDANTVIVTSQDPAPTMLSDVSTVLMYPKAYFDRVGKDGLMKMPLSTGPFMLKSWEPGTVAHLVRNPNYWDQPKPYLDGVDLMVVGDSNTQSLKLQAGEIDAAINLPITAAQDFGTSKDVYLVSKALKSSVVMMMNQTNPSQAWFKNVQVRQAINYAIDKTAIIKGALHGYATPMTTPLSVGQYVDPNGKPWPYDPAKAKDLLKAAGYEKGFTTTLLTNGNDPVFVSAATIVKNNLQAVGITVNLQPLDYAAARAAVVTAAGGATTTYEMALIYAYTNDSLDQGGIFRFCCVGNVPPSMSNRTGFDDPAIDALWAQSQIEGDPVKRAALFKQMQALVWDAAPHAFLWNDMSRAGARSKVRNFTITPTSYHPVTNVWMSK